eukprot:345483-Chlamydomonas_euryale.AAC.13
MSIVSDCSGEPLRSCTAALGFHSLPSHLKVEQHEHRLRPPGGPSAFKHCLPRCKPWVGGVQAGVPSKHSAQCRVMAAQQSLRTCVGRSLGNPGVGRRTDWGEKCRSTGWMAGWLCSRACGRVWLGQ